MTKVPVIIPIERGQYNPNYVIVIGFDDDNFYLEDSKRLGSIAYIPREELPSLWKIETKNPNWLEEQTALVIELKAGMNRMGMPVARD